MRDRVTPDNIIEQRPRLRKVIDGALPNFAYISIYPSETGNINLVIGAHYADNRACAFSKNDLGTLIETLQMVHSAMEDR